MNLLLLPPPHLLPRDTQLIPAPHQDPLADLAKPFLPALAEPLHLVVDLLALLHLARVRPCVGARDQLVEFLALVAAVGEAGFFKGCYFGGC